MNINKVLEGTKLELEIIGRLDTITAPELDAEIKQHIAPNIRGEIDLETARAFDYLCYKFAAKRFHPDKDLAKTARSFFI